MKRQKALPMAFFHQKCKGMAIRNNRAKSFLINRPSPMRPFAPQGIKRTDIAARIPPHMYPVISSLLDSAKPFVLYTHPHNIRSSHPASLRLTVFASPTMSLIKQIPLHPGMKTGTKNKNHKMASASCQSIRTAPQLNA